MREWDLFPDFEGFARANGQDRPFSREYGQLYEKNGLWPYKPSFVCMQNEKRDI